MSAKVQGWVWDLNDLLPQRRLILLWLANRATDNGVCFPGQAEVRKRTSLGEKMVRRHLHWLAATEDEDGQSKQPLVTIIERRIGKDRNTSNVYVLHVPWARRVDMERDLEELKHLPSDAATSLQGVGVTGDPQGTGQNEQPHETGGRARPPVGSPAGGKNPVTGIVTRTGPVPPVPPHGLYIATSSSRGKTVTKRNQLDHQALPIRPKPRHAPWSTPFTELSGRSRQPRR